MPSFVENVNKLANDLTVNLVNDITSVGNDLTNVDVVASNIASVNTTAGSIPSVNTVAGSIADVNIVGLNIADINTLAPVASDMDLLSPQAANIGIVATNVSSVVTAATYIDDINIVAADINQVGFSAIEDLGLITEPVTSNPVGTISYIKEVAEDIASVVTVGTNIASVVTTAGNITSVNTNAANIANINLVATQIVPNLAEILLADDNAALVSSLYDQFDDRYLGSKAVAPSVDNDGNALLVGALYFDSVMNRMREWNGLVWSDALTLTAGSVSTLTNKTIDNITNKVGANHIHHPCRNVSGVTILEGTVVTAQGTQSGTDYIEIIPVTNPQTQIALGITHSTILNNGVGLVMNTGVFADAINTSAWTVGTILYPNTSGGLTHVKPSTGIYQACALVLRQHATQGTMLVEFTEPRDTTAKIIENILNSGIPLDMGSIV